MIFVARTILASWKFAQVTEYVELMVRYFDVSLEQYPGDALVAGWCRQRSQVRPVAVVVCKYFLHISFYYHLKIVKFKRNICAEYFSETQFFFY